MLKSLNIIKYGVPGLERVMESGQISHPRLRANAGGSSQIHTVR